MSSIAPPTTGSVCCTSRLERADSIPSPFITGPLVGPEVDAGRLAPPTQYRIKQVFTVQNTHTLPACGPGCSTYPTVETADVRGRRLHHLTAAPTPSRATTTSGLTS